jgi:hypothetical protein
LKAWVLSAPLREKDRKTEGGGEEREKERERERKEFGMDKNVAYWD